MELNSHSKIFLDFLLAQNQIWKMFAIHGKMTSTSVQSITTEKRLSNQENPGTKLRLKLSLKLYPLITGENGRKFHETKKWICRNLLLANMSQIYILRSKIII